MSLDLTAVELVERVHDGVLTPSEVVDAYLNRIAEYDDLLEAFVTVDEEQVRAEAAWRGRQIAAGARLPLDGIAVGIKDNIDVAGLPTIGGFEPFRDAVATQDAAIVKALRSLGAIMLGKTHTTPFAMNGPVPTKNPWNLRKSPAASSSGSGAGIAAKMAPIAVGTQTGGSTLRPAAFNGVVGFKPTYDWISLDGVIPNSWSIDHLGLYGTTVADVSLVFHALRDSEPGPVVNGTDSLKLALVSDFMEMSSPEVAGHLRWVADQLENAGATVVEARLPAPFEHLFAIHQLIVSAERAAVHQENLARLSEYYAPDAHAVLDADALIPSLYVAQARRQRHAMAETYRVFMRDVDALIFPTVTTVPCDREQTGDFRLQVLGTTLGLPALSLPTGLNAEELPFATQVVSWRGDEARLLRVAEWITSVVPLIGKPDLEKLRVSA